MDKITTEDTLFSHRWSPAKVLRGKIRSLPVRDHRTGEEIYPVNYIKADGTVHDLRNIIRNYRLFRFACQVEGQRIANTSWYRDTRTVTLTLDEFDRVTFPKKENCNVRRLVYSYGNKRVFYGPGDPRQGS